MLAYVLWHWPSQAAGYVDALIGFHRALAAHPPAGFRGSRVLEVADAPWLPVARALEDWYFVDDFTALGVLNEAAVSGPRRAPHDAAARLAADGTAAVYRRLKEGARAPDRASWFAKPAGMTYVDLAARLPEAELWQRQMILGPAPEFCLLGASPPPEVAAVHLGYTAHLYRGG
jgi:hypothetical protein